MSNLGLYKWFTTTAKKVGGAGNLIGIFIGSGVVVGGIVGSAVTNAYRNIMDQKMLNCFGTYSVTKDSEIKKIKLTLKVGDQITVFANDNDSILIVKNGDKNNPYFVSSDFLRDYTDYQGCYLRKR